MAERRGEVSELTRRSPPNSAGSDAAARLYRRAVAAIHADRPARSAGLLRQALMMLGSADDPGLRVRVLVGLAQAEAEQARVQQGLALLTKAALAVAELGDSGLCGLVHGQQGVLLLRCGRVAEAVAELDAAVALLGTDRQELAMALLNRGAAHLHLRNLREAAADFDRCIQEAKDAQEIAAVAGMAKHNRGYVALLAGDIPAAVQEMIAARNELVPIDPGFAVIGAVDRARALKAAGLISEADAELATAAVALRAQRLPKDLAEVELERAEVALLDGRPVDARRWAWGACRRLRRAGGLTWAAQAKLVALQAAQLLGRAPARLADQARALAEQLQQAGLDEDARLARLVAARAALDAGQAFPATELATVTFRPQDRIGTRLLTRLVRAELAPDSHRRVAELRAGLRDLHRYQSRFGTLDLRTASVLHGRRLAELGLEAALADGRPSAVLAWTEQSRTLAFRLPPMRPPADPCAAELVAELRAVRTALSTAARTGKPERALQARRAALERQARSRNWFAPPEGATLQSPVRLGELRVALDGGQLVSYLVVGERLHALVVSTRQARVVPLGAAGPLAAAVRRVRADLDALALVVLPEQLREGARASLRDGLRGLHTALWAPLRDPGDGPVVVIPTNALAGMPWTSLPALRGRPVTVAPSATWWVQAREAIPAQGRPLFVAGPGLARAETEVALAAAAWPASTVLTADRATPAAVLAAAARSPLLHIAAHGVHEPDSPLFSALDLAGGFLFGYELPGGRIPPQVVLSGCDLGLATVRPNDEGLGMAAALLYAGAASVVAGVGALGDAVACRTMMAHHHALHTGHSPAAALADALAAAVADRAAEGARSDPAPLVCYGAGW
ncbi:MAG: CHAT domain-containing protein [Pseudonocardiaceae bacterium]